MRKIGAVILAAGESSRLDRPKQLIEFRGKRLVRRVTEAAEEAGCSSILVVTGNGRAKVEAELSGTRAITVENKNWRRGIGTSIRAGVERAIDLALKGEAQEQHKEGRFPNRPSAARRLTIKTGDFQSSRRTGDRRSLEAILLLTCDQPFVDGRTIEGLVALWETTGKAIVASAYSDTLGVPALFDRSCFQELLALADDTGAKPIIMSNRDRVAAFPFPEGALDIDTVEDLEKLKGL